VQGLLKTSVMFSSDLSYSQAILIEPPKKILKSDYICSKRFSLDSILEMYEAGETHGVVAVSGKEVNIYLVTKTGNHIEFKLKHSKDVSLHNSTRKGGQSANRIHRLGVEKRNRYLTYVSEKMVSYFMTKNNTEKSVKSILIVGPGQLKQDIVNEPLVKQYFPDAVYKTSENLQQSTVEKVFLEFINSTWSKKEDPIISEIEEIIERGEVDTLIFGDKYVQDAHEEYLLKIIIANNKEDFELYKEKEEATGCRVVFSTKLAQYGIIGVKWY